MLHSVIGNAVSGNMTFYVSLFVLFVFLLLQKLGISTLALLSQNSDLDLMLVRSAELAEILFFAYVARG